MHGDMHGELILSNNTIIGLSKLRISNVRTHFLEVFRLETDINIPSISSKGSVKINGNFNLFRMNC